MAAALESSRLGKVLSIAAFIGSMYVVYAVPWFEAAAGCAMAGHMFTAWKESICIIRMVYSCHLHGTCILLVYMCCITAACLLQDVGVT